MPPLGASSTPVEEFGDQNLSGSVLTASGLYNGAGEAARWPPLYIGSLRVDQALRARSRALWPAVDARLSPPPPPPPPATLASLSDDGQRNGQNAAPSMCVCVLPESVPELVFVERRRAVTAVIPVTAVTAVM